MTVGAGHANMPALFSRFHSERPLDDKDEPLNADAESMGVAGAARTTSPMSRLSIMMFLQYAIWGAWLPLFFPFLLNHRGMPVGQVGNLIAIGALGALFAPFIVGQIADRWFNTERFLGISHIIGGVLVYVAALLAVGLRPTALRMTSSGPTL